MTDDLPDSVRDALNDAKEAFEPPSDPDELEPDYPADMTPEERVDHVLTNEYPRWRGMEWIAAAADTDIEQAQSVVREHLSEGEVEVSGEGVRRNRYHVYFEEVEELTEKLDDRGQIW
ncbi:hypothetical protein [Halobellus ruber]|uniref:Uncharacterized protein n=1 Tax=Halobellus ruber TaxID=2761102 RepID=A0A7J9SLN1_9EURY|nr:hypothetical protein [Halobellus ruber]MBB6646917.1 hypothetical protein [Halobellus ruber]